MPPKNTDADQSNPPGDPVLQDPLETAPVKPEDSQALEEIFARLMKILKVDFSHYRRTTTTRRLSRRMSLSRKSSYSEYLDYLEKNPDELEQLYDDLLLSVTQFFRDPHIFEGLKENVFPKLIRNRSAKTPVRIWVPGCSTGEEVYSLAISFYEYLEETHSKTPVQFFGTDLVQRHIVKARAAVYTDRIRENISPERLERFFDQTSQGLKVIKHIREMCVFAVQDIINDPPFPHIDLVSCRNVLIYFDKSFQEIVIPLFHFSLKPSGFLLMGSSETVGNFSEYFNTADSKINLFSKRNSGTKPSFRFPFQSIPSKQKSMDTDPAAGRLRKTGPEKINPRIADILLENYAPPGVLVDSNMQIQQFIGRTFPYLAPGNGQASLKLTRMTGEGLMPDIYVAIEEVRKKKRKIRKKNVTFQQNDMLVTTDISVIPVQDTDTGDNGFLVMFEVVGESDGVTALPLNLEDVSGNTLDLIKQELDLTKQHLQSIIEEKDEVNQELWAANEEIQSTNEELQSVNEEMEAAKEELESSNEELIALNEEMFAKNLELNTAKEFAENLVETASTMIITLDCDACITTFNRYAETLTGYHKDEVLGKNWFEHFIPEADRKTIPAVFQDVLNNIPRTFQHENHIITKNGDLRLIRWRNNILTNNIGNISGALSIGTDITEYRQAEAALKASRKKLTTLFDAMTEMVVLHELTFDSNGKPADYQVTDCNRIFTQTTGITRETALKHPASILYQADPPPYLEKYARVALTGEPYQFTTYYPPLDRHFMISAVCPEKNQFATITTDITEIRLAQEALQESEARFKNYIESAPDGIFVVDESGRYTDVNAAACRITGYKRDELLDMGIMDLVPSSETEAAKAHFETVVRSGRASGELTFLTRDRTVRYWMVETVKLSDRRFLGFAKDITENRQIEEQFRQAAKMEAIGQLAGGIAHDFNNILHMIIGNTELALEDVPGASPIHANLEEIKTAGMRAAGIVQQLLNFSRKTALRLIPVDAATVIKDSLHFLRSSIPATIDIKTDIQIRNISLLADPIQINQVMMNICTNAFQAMEKTGGTLSITVSETKPAQDMILKFPDLSEKNYVQITIQDTGPGIDPAIMNRIFDPYFTTKAFGKGSGMGLAVVQGIIKTHRGAVTVDSQPGSGTCFTLFFPVTDKNPPDEMKPVETLPRGTESILFVDDEEPITTMAKKMLTRLGYQVEPKLNPEDALELFRGQPERFDLVITDMTMPRMTGVTLSEALKRIRPDIPIIICTGHSSLIDKENTLNLGISGYLMKPVPMSKLAKTIRRILDIRP